MKYIQNLQSGSNLLENKIIFIMNNDKTQYMAIDSNQGNLWCHWFDNKHSAIIFDSIVDVLKCLQGVAKDFLQKGEYQIELKHKDSD